MPKPVILFDKQEWDKYLSKIDANLKDVSEHLKAMYKIYGAQDIDDHFRKEEGPDGPWKQRSAKTQKWYQDINDGKELPPKGGVGASNYDPNNNLLEMTGYTRKSLLGDKNNTRKLNNTSILIVAGPKYSGLQNDGGTANVTRQFKEGRNKEVSFKVPARTFMWLAESAKKRMVDALAKMLLP